jgi:tRNA (uracil-5-)-methyltransferase TRM9
MREEIRQQLLALNRAFYSRLALPFARSRSRPQPGWNRLAAQLPEPCPTLLDVGCGEGRFGRFLLERQRIGRYSGIDFSAELLAQARRTTPGDFYERDLSAPQPLAGLGRHAAIACLSTLQHVPGRAGRLLLLREMAAHLLPTGRLLLANWQFLDNARQRRKVVTWPAVALSTADVEANDYLLSWQREGPGLRYVCLIDAAETAALAHESGLEVVDQFRSDGREGDLNLYTILTPGAVHRGTGTYLNASHTFSGLIVLKSGSNIERLTFNLR